MMHLSVALLFPMFVIATASAQMIDPSVIEKIQQARMELKNASGQTGACTLPQAASCTGAEYCKELEKNADKAIIYKNDQGESIPNLALLKFNDELEGCLGAEHIDFFDDPLLNIQALQSAKAAGSLQQMVKNRTEWEKANEKAKPLLEETRQGLLKILDERKNGSNDAVIEDMKKRISTIRLAEVQQVQSSSLDFKCKLPNARFRSEDYTIEVCPQLLRMPSATLQMIIAHEMAHAIDPCNAAKDFYSNGKVSSNVATRLPAEASKVAQAGKMISAGVEIKNNPFSSVISCLQKPTSIGVPFPEAVIAAWDEYRACYDVSNSALMQEGFSDWMSSQFLKNKVASMKNPDAAKRYAFESQALFLVAGCNNLPERVLNTVAAKIDQNQKQSIKNRCRYLMGLQGDIKHPKSDARIGRLFWAPKEMQKALNCKPTDAVECK